MTTGHLRQPTLDCAEPRELAEFYRQLLGWVYADGHEEPDPEGDDFLLLIDPDRPGAARVPALGRDGRRRGGWARGCTSTSTSTTWTSGTTDAVRLGARPLTGTPEEEGHADDPFRVYADPSGHPFCLCLADQ